MKIITRLSGKIIRKHNRNKLRNKLIECSRRVVEKHIDEFVSIKFLMFRSSRRFSNTDTNTAIINAIKIEIEEAYPCNY
jgi:hypothetical protein